MKSAVFWIVLTSVNLIYQMRKYFFVSNSSDWFDLIFAIVVVIYSIYWIYKDILKIKEVSWYILYVDTFPQSSYEVGVGVTLQTYRTHLPSISYFFRISTKAKK